MRNSSIVAFLFIHFIISVTALQTACGDPNEQFYESTRAPTCDTNCQDLERQCSLTTDRGVAGCYCRAGYARNLRQTCIPIRQCAADCFPNEHPIRPRKRACEYTCRRATRVNICYRATERKCVCAPLHCRNNSAQCVRDF